MIQQIKGRVAKQAHVGIPEGLYEHELGRQGFTGRVALFYRRNPPIEYTRIEGFCRNATSPGFMPRLTCSPPFSSATNPPSDSSTTIT